MSGYGLLQMGQNLKQDGMTGLREASGMERQRNATNDAMKAQKRQGEMTSVATGAAMGFMIGGPMGAGIGALAGWALS